MNVDIHGDLHIKPEALVAKHIAAVGKTGSGKTNSVSVLTEIWLSAGWPATFIDPLDQFYPLKSAYPIVLAEKAGKRKDMDVEITPENAAALAKFSVTQRVSVILNLKFYRQAEAMQILQVYLEAMWDCLFQVDQPQPYCLVIDEAHMYVPQGKSTPLSETIIDVAKMGRHVGMTTMVTTQRPAAINKEFLTQFSLLLGHRMVLGVDMAIFHDLLNMPRKEVNNQLKRLKTGEAIILGDEIFIGEADHLKVQVRPAIGVSGTSVVAERGKIKPLTKAMIKALQEALDVKPKAPEDSVDVTALKLRIHELEGRVNQMREEYAQALTDQETQISESYEQQLRDLEEAKNKEINTLQKQLRMMQAQPAQVIVPTKSVPLMDVGTVHAQEVTAQRLRVLERTTTTTERVYEEGHLSSRQMTMRVNRQEQGFSKLLRRVENLSLASRRILAVMLESKNILTSDELQRMLDYAYNTVRNAMPGLVNIGLVQKLDTGQWKPVTWELLLNSYPDLDTNDLLVQLIDTVSEEI